MGSNNVFIDEFSKNVEKLRNEFKFKIISKVHIICDHIRSFARTTGNPLDVTSDQLTESMHQYDNKTLRRCCYIIKDVYSDSYANKF